MDILIDSQLKPWLIEVNICPSLSTGSKLDKKIKYSLISDTCNLLGFTPYDKETYKYQQELIDKGQLEEDQKQSKLISEIQDLNAKNCLQKLNHNDFNILFEFDEENYRTGQYKRIFPLANNIDMYKQYFEFPRYSNVLVWKFLQSEENFLNKICKQINFSNV